MMANAMRLSIYLPNRIFADEQGVLSIVAEGSQGSIGLLPNRLDCLLPLVPGILTYVSRNGPVYLAVDEGVLTKTGPEVRISVRHAIDGAALGELKKMVEQEFLRLDEAEQNMRTAVSELESTFIRHFLKLKQR
jgi:F-type H+-transporting ATPase subunit epsilon